MIVFLMKSQCNDDGKRSCFMVFQTACPIRYRMRLSWPWGTPSHQLFGSWCKLPRSWAEIYGAKMLLLSRVWLTFSMGNTLDMGNPLGIIISYISGWWFGTFFYFSIYWEQSSQLPNIFQRG